jgi:hypothetical protein
MQEAAEARQVFGMLLEQHGDDPLGRNEPDEPPLLVYNSEAALIAADGTPGGHFLIDAGPHRRWSRVHQLLSRSVVRGGEKVLDVDESLEFALLVADRDFRDGVEPDALQLHDHVRDPRLGRHPRDGRTDVLRRGPEHDGILPPCICFGARHARIHPPFGFVCFVADA